MSGLHAETYERAWEAIELMEDGVEWRTADFCARWEVSKTRTFQILRVARDLMEEHEIPGTIINWRLKGEKSQDERGNQWRIERNPLAPTTKWNRNVLQRARFSLAHQRNSARMQTTLAEAMPAHSPARRTMMKSARFSETSVDILEDVVNQLEADEIEALFDSNLTGPSAD